MMLNHAALDLLKVASQNYGFADTCTNFELTHDVGMGEWSLLVCLFVWLFCWKFSVVEFLEQVLQIDDNFARFV